MPEQRDPRFVKWTLVDAEHQGYYVRTRCTSCKITRLYRPADLIKLLGNRERSRLTWGMRCEKCGDKEFFDADFYHPTATEMQGKTIRRLVEIKTIRRPIWRDEPA